MNKDGAAPRVVLHLITELDVGGAQTMLLRLLQSTDRSRISPVVACFYNGDKAIAQQIRALEIDVIDLETTFGAATEDDEMEAVAEELEQIVDQLQRGVIGEEDLLDRLDALDQRLAQREIQQPVDLDERLSAWRASKEVGPVLRDGLVELQGLRNGVARANLTLPAGDETAGRIVDQDRPAGIEILWMLQLDGDLQAFLVDRLEADEDGHATAALQGGEHLGIVGDIQGCLDGICPAQAFEQRGCHHQITDPVGAYDQYGSGLI